MQEFPSQFPSLSISRWYKPTGYQMLCCKISSVAIYFKMTSYAGLFWKVSAISFSSTELPLTSLLKHGTCVTRGFHDYHVREFSVHGKSHVTSERERNNKDHKTLKAFHRMCFSMLFNSIDAYLHTQAYLEEPQSVSGSASNYR